MTSWRPPYKLKFRPRYFSFIIGHFNPESEHNMGVPGTENSIHIPPSEEEGLCLAFQVKPTDICLVKEPISQAQDWAKKQPKDQARAAATAMPRV